MSGFRIEFKNQQNSEEITKLVEDEFAKGLGQSDDIIKTGWTDEARAAARAVQQVSARGKQKEEALRRSLAHGAVHNEDGESMTDFENQGRDSKDFGSVSRGNLHAMLSHAYDQGHAHGAVAL